MDQQHPCGSLPVSGISVSAFYCHHHQAWWATSMSHLQTSEFDLEVTASASMSFGPFDTEDDVKAWMLRALLGMDDLLP
jgi:hypothetical protein